MLGQESILTKRDNHISRSLGLPVCAQVLEIYEQLLGRSGERQVEGDEIGLTHNVGATGGTAVVHILKRL